MKKKFRFQWGAFLLFLLFAGLFFILLTRIITIQATGQVEGQELAARAAAKYSQEEVLTAKRGRILDRNGEVIAEDTLTYRMVAVLDDRATQNPNRPRHVTDTEETAEVLAGYLGSSKEVLLNTLNTGVSNNRYQVEFGNAGREISHTVMQQIEEENLPGILFVRDLKRMYPNGIFASHLIGFALKEELEDGQMVTKGKMGLEAIHDEVLTGKNGKMEFNTDKWGYLLPNNESAIVPAVDGADVQLTLDKTLQNFLEDAMSNVQEEYSPSRIIAVVADPATGEILAMSQRPSFNPNTREGLSDNWLNESIELTIEPGSPMKMFTLAAAIEEGKWDPNAFYDSGSYTLYDRTIRDHNRDGWGSITYLEGFQRSSNTSMAYLLERLGADTFMEYHNAFGFGEKTGIDLPNEAEGRILDDYAIEKLTNTYGQGSTMTPIQMIQAASAVANEGVMMRPYVIDQIVNPDTEEVSHRSEPEEAGQPISAQTAAQVLDVLASTVTAEAGSAKRFALQDYTVAGKTGTAQIPGEDGRYMTGRDNYLYSFLGMAPAEDPELLIYIGVQQPKLPADEYGSEPVSKIFTSVMENGLKYMNIEPENTETAISLALEDYSGRSFAEVESELAEMGLTAVPTSDGAEIEAQYPQAGESVISGNTVLLKTSGASVLPDFSGWSKRELLAFQFLSGLSLEIAGQGFAAEQSVSPGTSVEAGEPVVIKLMDPAEIYKNHVQESTVEESEESLEAGIEDNSIVEDEVIEDVLSEDGNTEEITEDTSE